MSYGQVYVKVRADENAPMQMNAGGSNNYEAVTSIDATIRWSPSGGIQNTGWTVSINGIPTEIPYTNSMSIDETNELISNYYNDVSLGDLLTIPSCVRFGF